NAQPAVVYEVFTVALDGDNVNRFSLVRVHVDHEAEIRRQVSADFAPVVAGVVRAHYVPVLLHEEHARPLGMHGDVVHAVADFGGRIGDVLRTQALIYGLPVIAAVVGAESTRSGDCDPHALRIAGIKNNAMEAHAASARLPLGTGAVAAQAGEFVPVLATVARAENGGVLHAGIDRVGIGERRLQMPDALE